MDIPWKLKWEINVSFVFGCRFLHSGIKLFDKNRWMLCCILWCILYIYILNKFSFQSYRVFSYWLTLFYLFYFLRYFWMFKEERKDSKFSFKIGRIDKISSNLSKFFLKKKNKPLKYRKIVQNCNYATIPRSISNKTRTKINSNKEVATIQLLILTSIRVSF